MNEQFKETVDTFLKVFDGYENRHLQLHGKAQKNDKGKVTTAKPVTVEGPITPDLVAQHIKGEASVGVAPVPARTARASSASWTLTGMTCRKMT